MKKPSFDADVMDQRESNQVNMTIKNYNLKSGISRQVFDKKD